MLHTELSGSEEDIQYFPMYFYASNPEPPGAGPFWPMTLSFEQILYRTIG